MEILLTDSNEDFTLIQYQGIEYAFMINIDHGIAVRRIDKIHPTLSEVQLLTHYIISEGWADHLTGFDLI